MADNRLIQPGIYDLRSRIFLAAVWRWLELDLLPLWLKHIDTVDSEVLPHLAEEFDVLGYKGWLLAETDQERRDLIKSSIELHRYAGTPYAIARAIESVGYSDVAISENPPLRYQGLPFRYNGIDFYDGIFAGGCEVSLTSAKLLSQTRIRLIYRLILVWKNARSHLLELFINGVPLFNELLYYDGTWEYNNTEEFDGIKREGIPDWLEN